MAHQIEQFSDGTAAFFTARVPAWHRLGTVTDGALTAEDALRIARLDWTVNKTEDPIHSTVLTGDGVARIVLDDKYLTYRNHPVTDQPEALGVVGSAYTPFQNTEAFAFLSSVADESGAVFETAGSLDGGKRVFVTMKMPETLMIGGVDAVDLNLIAWNSHDGTSAFGAAITPVRVVCQNTLTIGLAQAVSRVTFRHTASIKGRVQQAREALALSFRVSEEFQREAENLINTTMMTPEFVRFVDDLLPINAQSTERVQDNVDRQRAEVKALWNAPTQANVAGTRWAAYNAVTEWADWARGVRGGDEGRARRTLLDMTDFASTDIKVKAMRSLLTV